MMQQEATAELKQGSDMGLDIFSASEWGPAHIDVAPEILQTQAAGVLKLFPKRPGGEGKARQQCPQCHNSTLYKSRSVLGTRESRHAKAVAPDKWREPQ